MKIMTEKYRPNCLDEVIGQKTIVELLKRYVKEKHMTHLLFSGDPGTGKTSCAMALIKELYGKDYSYNTLIINASKETGIDNIRTKVNEFAMTRIVGEDCPFKIIFLDECDHLTEPSQAALRRVMEQYSEHTRFILSCNYLYKVIKPIQDRCSLYRFTQLDFDDLFLALTNIVKTENIDISDECLRVIASSSRGSLRRAITTLEDVTIGTDKVQENTVRNLVCQVMTDTQVINLIKLIKDGDVYKLQDKMYELRSHGIPPEEIIEDIMYGYDRTDTDIKKKFLIIAKCADYDYRISVGANPYIQMMAFFRDIMKIEGGN